MLVKKAHAVDSKFWPVSHWRQLSCVLKFLQSYHQKLPVSYRQPILYECRPSNVKIITIKLLLVWTNDFQTFRFVAPFINSQHQWPPARRFWVDFFDRRALYHLDGRALLFLTYTIEKKNKKYQWTSGLRLSGIRCTSSKLL